MRVLLRWLVEKWSSGSICFDQLRSPIIGKARERGVRPMRPVRKSICLTKQHSHRSGRLYPLPDRVANKSEEIDF